MFRAMCVPRRNAKKELFSWADLYVNSNVRDKSYYWVILTVEPVHYRISMSLMMKNTLLYLCIITAMKMAHFFIVKTKILVLLMDIVKHCLNCALKEN